MVMPASLPGHDYAVTVKNVGDGPLYLNIALQQVMNPGMEHERKLPLSEIERPGLLAHPDRLSLGPGQSRKIALKSLVEPTAEALYRLYVIPAKVMQVEQAPQDKITAPMSVAIGYGVLVRHAAGGQADHGLDAPLRGSRNGVGEHRHRARGAAGCAGGQVRHGAESGLVSWRAAAHRGRQSALDRERRVALAGVSLTDAEREMAMTTLPDASRRGLWLVLLAALCCALLPAAGMAAGVLKLSHAEIWLRGDGRTSRLYAENAGDTTLYLDVEQRLLRNPGEQPEELTPIGEVRNPTLLVAPVRLALAPGQRAPITLKELARPRAHRSGG